MVSDPLVWDHAFLLHSNDTPAEFLIAGIVVHDQDRQGLVRHGFMELLQR